MAEAVLETTSEVQAELPLATTEALTEQPLPGAVKLAVKLVDAPGARLDRETKVDGEVWLLTTVTLFKVTSPGLLTVPV